MDSTPSARARRPRVPRVVLVGLALVVAAFVGTIGHASVSSSDGPFGEVLRVGHHAGLGEEDGVVPGGTTVTDDLPAVTRLDPDLLHALRRAAAGAAEDGVEMHVNSGWRSRSYQQRLFEEAVSRYGSKEAAARWVAAPGTSAHERGDAVDLGPVDATGWLSAHGERYGLCRVYDDEPWHFERRPGAVDRGCPATYADPSRDPRMQR